MKKVTRAEILDYVTYGEQRDALRAQVLAIKQPRRVHVGEHLTFLFETSDTVRYQIQEMIRTEQIVKEAEIQHEIDTYNELLGERGELGCTLLIEIDDPVVRAERLRAWRTLPEHIALLLEDGSLAPARFDPRQIGDDRLSAVQFLKFDAQGRAPVAVRIGHPALSLEVALDPAQKAALRADLA